MFLLLCLLFFSPVCSMAPQDIIKVNSLQSLHDLHLDFKKDISHVVLDDEVMAHAMHHFIFPTDNDAGVIEMIKDRLEILKNNNKPSYDNLTPYILYKTSKLAFKDPLVTDIDERLYSTTYDDFKDAHYTPLALAKMYIKLITQKSYQDYLYEKDKARKRALICATIRSGALFPVLATPANKRRKSNG